MNNEMELAKLFIQYAEEKEKITVLENVIKQEILMIGESRKIGGVTATYYQPSQDVNYEQAAKDHDAPLSLIDKHATMKVIVKWKEVAEVVCPDLSPYATPVPARVVIK